MQSTGNSYWQTELIGLSALDGNTEKVQSHLSKLGESIRRVGLDMDGYAQAAAKAMNGIDLETAWNQGGEALDNFANDYVRSMKEFGASAEETYTGAALIRQGFHSIAEAAAKGELDNVTAQANELAHKIDAIPADKHIVINASGDISIIEDVKPVITVTGSTGIFTIGNNGVNITVKHQGNFIIDCKKEIVYNGNTSLMKDTAGAFFELAPDTDNTITIIGTGTAQINYIPQFLYDATLDNMDWGDK